MIPYEELDRALARWKAKSQGGVPEAPPAAAAAAPVSEGTPVVVDEMGSIPQPASGPERTGEIDLAELETYEEQE
jgi:hypothetical protein